MVSVRSLRHSVRSLGSSVHSARRLVREIYKRIYGREDDDPWDADVEHVEFARVANVGACRLDKEGYRLFICWTMELTPNSMPGSSRVSGYDSETWVFRVLQDEARTNFSLAKHKNDRVIDARLSEIVEGQRYRMSYTHDPHDFADYTTGGRAGRPCGEARVLAFLDLATGGVLGLAESQCLRECFGYNSVASLVGCYLTLCHYFEYNFERSVNNGNASQVGGHVRLCWSDIEYMGAGFEESGCRYLKAESEEGRTLKINVFGVGLRLVHARVGTRNKWIYGRELVAIRADSSQELPPISNDAILNLSSDSETAASEEVVTRILRIVGQINPSNLVSGDTTDSHGREFTRSGRVTAESAAARTYISPTARIAVGERNDTERESSAEQPEFVVRTAVGMEKNIYVVCQNDGQAETLRRLRGNSLCRVSIADESVNQVDQLDKYQLSEFIVALPSVRHEIIDVPLDFVEATLRGKCVCVVSNGISVLGNFRARCRMPSETELRDYHSLKGSEDPSRTLYAWQMGLRAKRAFIVLATAFGSFFAGYSITERAGPLPLVVLGSIVQGISISITAITLFAGSMVRAGAGPEELIYAIYRGEEVLYDMEEVYRKLRTSREALLVATASGAVNTDWMSPMKSSAFYGKKTGTVSLGGVSEVELNTVGIFYATVDGRRVLADTIGKKVRGFTNHYASVHASEDAVPLWNTGSFLLEEAGMADLA